jgi:hypothetical protein
MVTVSLLGVMMTTTIISSIRVKPSRDRAARRERMITSVREVE